MVVQIRKMTICRKDHEKTKQKNQKTMVYLHNGILRSREKEGAYTLCNSMDGTGEHDVK